jgi:kinesin family protein 11
MEETLSTLDYSMRAKSIRNKPEVNQRMTRNSLLKEYVAEIERLKADVLAAREKNGIFFSEENWNKISVEHELKVSEADEAKKQVDIVEGQLRAVREEFEQSIAVLMKTNGELTDARQRLQDREKEVVARDGQLIAVKGALEEEVVVRRAHQDTEHNLNDVARGLKQVVQAIISDLGRVFDKLGDLFVSSHSIFFLSYFDSERNSALLGANSKAVTLHTKTIFTESHNLTTKLDAFVQASNLHSRRIRTEIDQWQTRELEHLSTQSNSIKEQLSKMSASLQVVSGQEDISNNAIDMIQLAIQDVVNLVVNGYNSWMGETRKSNEKICEQAEAASISNCVSVSLRLSFVS